MTWKNSSFFLFLLLPILASGQEKLLRFKVVADSASVSQINVVNLVNEKSTSTDSNGEFTVLAKADDLLVLQKETLEYKRYLIEEEDLKKDIIIIKMIPKPVALQEVIVSQKAERDDLSKHKDPRKFTPAERKLYTARSGLLDRPLNAISGRTNQLRKEVNVEMKERLLARTETVFEEKYYIETLKIPEEYIRDFQHYLIDNPEFVSALKARNKTLLRFHAAKLSTSYHELMAQEVTK